MKIKVLTKEEIEKRKSEHARVISDLTKKIDVLQQRKNYHKKRLTHFNKMVENQIEMDF